MKRTPVAVILVFLLGIGGGALWWNSQRSGSGDGAMRPAVATPSTAQAAAGTAQAAAGTAAAAAVAGESFDPAAPSGATIASRTRVEDLGRKAEYSPEVQKQLIAALSHGDQDVRGHACWALGRMAPQTIDAVPDLVKALGDKEWPVRHNAAWALRHFPTARAALRGALKDDDVRRRVGAASTLLALGAEATATVERVLLDAWETAELPVRTQVLSGLGLLRPASPASIKVLSDALASGDDTFQKTALAGLSAQGSAARSAVPLIVKMLDDKNKRVRMAAAMVLGQIGRDSPEAIAALVELLADKKDRPAFAAAAALAHLGALDALEAAQNSPSKRVRSSVMEGVAATPRLQARHVQFVIRALKDPEWEVRLGAAGLLQGRKEPAARGAVEALAVTALDKNEAVAQQALATLQSIDPKFAAHAAVRAHKAKKRTNKAEKRANKAEKRGATK